MNEKLKLEFDLDYVKTLESDNSLSIVQLDLLHLGTNRNKCNISEECVNKSLPTFFNKPIIYRLNNKIFIEDSTDVVEHARNQDEEKTIFIGGSIPESSPVEFIEKNGKTYLRMTGIIYKLYQKTLSNILKSKNGEIKVSIELTVEDGYHDDDGILVINEFKLLSVCLLGNGIKEGIEGSNLVVTKFSLNDFNNHYLTFSSKEEKYKIPQEVKESAKKGLELRKEYGRGSTSVGVATAKYLISNEYAIYEKVKHVSKYFPRHEGDNLKEKNPPSNGYISFEIWGGYAGWKWSKAIVDKKEKELEKEKEINTLVYNRDGLSDDLDCVKAENESDVINNIEDTDKKIGIKDKEGEKMDEAIKVENSTEEVIEAVVENSNEEVVENSEVVENAIESVEEEKVENAKTEETEEVVENAVKEDEVVEVVENSEVEDEDCWKNKYEELENKCNAMEEELCKYKKAEEFNKMYSLLEQYAHCYSESEKEIMKVEMEKCSYDEFEKKVDNKIKEFAMNMKNEKKEEVKGEEKVVEEVKNTLQFSVSPFGVQKPYDFSKDLSEDGGLDSIIKNSGVKFK